MSEVWDYCRKKLVEKKVEEFAIFLVQSYAELGEMATNTV